MKLEQEIREVMHFKDMEIRTEDEYVTWYQRFVRFHGLRHPREMGAPEGGDVRRYHAHERRVGRADCGGEERRAGFRC